MTSTTVAAVRGRRARWPVLLGLAFAVASGVGLATVFWTSGLVDGEYVAGLQGRLDTTQSAPGVALAMLVALGIGASMVVLRCGFPAVFAVPTILEREQHTAGRLRALIAFTLGGVIPLIIVGLLLGLAGDGVWELLSTPAIAHVVRHDHLLVTRCRGGRVRAQRVWPVAHARRV